MKGPQCGPTHSHGSAVVTSSRRLYNNSSVSSRTMLRRRSCCSMWTISWWLARRRLFGDDLGNRFGVKDLGEARNFLGYTSRDRPNRRVCLSQATYAKKIVAKYDHDDLKPAVTPWLPGLVLPTTDESVRRSLFARLAHSTMTLFGTRPDIAYTVSKLSEANVGPSKEYLALLKRLFRYIVGTIDLGLVYGREATTRRTWPVWLLRRPLRTI